MNDRCGGLVIYKDKGRSTSTSSENSAKSY
jgi:hypothetical protein